MDSSVILIGPHRVGKSTVGELLAERLGLPFCPLGERSGRYFEEARIDHEAANRLMKERGFEAAYRYLKPFQAYALERGLAEHPCSVLEVDPTQSVYEDDALLARARQVLQSYEYVVLLLPSPDVEESVRILEERRRVLFEGMELNEHFVRHRSNRELATLTVYTEGRTPEEARDEILRRMDPSQSEIVLIGPMRAGKSTVGWLLARELGVPEVEMDALRWGYYGEVGYDPVEQARIEEAEGFAGVYRYWKRFDLHALGRVLEDHPGSVIHLGAGHSVYEDGAQLARARELLARYRNVVLLLPSPDPEESVAILRERSRHRIGGVELDRHLVMLHSNQDLARFTVYTECKTPEETADEILHRVGT